MTKRRRFTADFKANNAVALTLATRRQDDPELRSPARHKVIEPVEHVEAPGDGRAERGVFQWRREGPHGPRRGDPRSPRQDRPAHGGTRFFGQRAQAMSRGDRKAMIARDRPGLPPPMPSADDQPLLVLLRAEGREPGEPGTACVGSTSFAKYPWIWQPPDGPSVAARRRPRRSSPGSASHAIDGPTGDLPSAENQRSPPVASGLSLSLKGMAIEGTIRSGAPTFIPVRRGFLYLVAIMDWATRHRAISNTMDASFCVERLG